MLKLVSMNETLILIFQLIVLLFSVMVHEVTHGVVAHALGDNTAKDAGRLNLNPLKHLDPFGSVILPLLLALPALFGQPTFIFGWAKPVPYDPSHLKNPRIGAALIGIAGPLSNFALAIIFAVLIRLLASLVGLSAAPMLLLLNIIVFINVLLGIFNLVPIPPLDGSKVLFALISDRYLGLKIFLERNGLLLVLMFIFFGFGLLIPIVRFIYSLLVGQWALL
ncbi:MAG: site-2 protease family protein [bacterium]|nr:site-2 protease family protein [bacterium]